MPYAQQVSTRCAKPQMTRQIYNRNGSGELPSRAEMRSRIPPLDQRISTCWLAGGEVARVVLIFVRPRAHPHPLANICAAMSSMSKDEATPILGEIKAGECRQVLAKVAFALRHGDGSTAYHRHVAIRTKQSQVLRLPFANADQFHRDCTAEVMSPIASSLNRSRAVNVPRPEGNSPAMLLLNDQAAFIGAAIHQSAWVSNRRASPHA